MPGYFIRRLIFQLKVKFPSSELMFLRDCHESIANRKWILWERIETVTVSMGKCALYPLSQGHPFTFFRGERRILA